mmetsp:Transcript_487/g.1249  ORF Transcript_487/g.1249 Transcript_487/m.1249 type:complete len:278 (-) Transcript_487:279-1112(-)
MWHEGRHERRLVGRRQQECRGGRRGCLCVREGSRPRLKARQPANTHAPIHAHATHTAQAHAPRPGQPCGGHAGCHHGIQAGQGHAAQRSPPGVAHATHVAHPAGCHAQRPHAAHEACVGSSHRGCAGGGQHGPAHDGEAQEHRLPAQRARRVHSHKPGQQQDITASRAQARTCRHHGSHGHVHGLATCRDEDGTVALTDQLGDDVGHHVGPAVCCDLDGQVAYLRQLRHLWQLVHVECHLSLLRVRPLSCTLLNFLLLSIPTAAIALTAFPLMRIPI